MVITHGSRVRQADSPPLSETVYPKNRLLKTGETKVWDYEIRTHQGQSYHTQKHLCILRKIQHIRSCSH